MGVLADVGFGQQLMATAGAILPLATLVKEGNAEQKETSKSALRKLATNPAIRDRIKREGGLTLAEVGA